MPLRDAANGQVLCSCGKTVSDLGHHAFTCGKLQRTHRHNRIKSALFNAIYKDNEANARGLQGRVEVPMDAVFPCKQGAPPAGPKHIVCDIQERHQDDPNHQVAIDVTVTFPKPSIKDGVDSSSLEGRGTAAKAAEAKKEKYYGSRHVIPDGGLVPVALEVFGTMGAQGDSHLRKVISKHVRPLISVPVAGKEDKFVDH